MELQESNFPPVNLQAISRSTTHEVEATPAGRADLAFSLRLPIGWVCDPQSLVPPGDGTAWSPLAAFGNKASPGLAMVTVLWRRLNVEVPLDEWVIGQMAGLGVNLISCRLWEDARGTVVDIGGTFVGKITGPAKSQGAGAESHPAAQLAAAIPSELDAAVRAMARCDGQDALMVWGICPRESYAASADELAIAGATFNLKRAPSATGPEPLQRAAGDAPGFELLYPASWMHRPMPDTAREPGKSGLDLILAPAGSLDAFVHIKAIDARIVTDINIEKLIQDATEEMAEAGVVLTEAWQRNADTNITSTPDIEIALTAGGAVQQAAYEIHFGVVQRPPLVVCVTAIIIALKTDALACMRGRRAYKIALATVRPC